MNEALFKTIDKLSEIIHNLADERDRAVEEWKIMLNKYSAMLDERDEARRVARRLYKRLCDEHTKRIVAEAIYPYWAKKGPEIAAENEKLIELLYEVEFCEGVYGECLWCEGNKWDGHMPHCSRQKALKDEINHGC